MKRVEQKDSAPQDSFRWPICVQLEPLKEMEGAEKIFEEIMGKRNKKSPDDENYKPQI